MHLIWGEDLSEIHCPVLRCIVVEQPLGAASEHQRAMWHFDRERTLSVVEFHHESLA